MSHFSLKGSSGILKPWTVLCNLVQESDEIPWFRLVPVSESIMSSRWPLNGSPCFQSKCMVLAVGFKIIGYTLKRESLVVSVCTGKSVESIPSLVRLPFDVMNLFDDSSFPWLCYATVSILYLWTNSIVSLGCPEIMCNNTKHRVLMNCKIIHALDNLFYMDDHNNIKVSLENWS